jgi:hypothetical protein
MLRCSAAAGDSDSVVAAGPAVRGVGAGATDVGQTLRASQPHGAWPKPGAKGFFSDLQMVPFGGVISFAR